MACAVPMAVSGRRFILALRSSRALQYGSKLSFMKACRPSIALYQALIDAHVSTETATAAALSIEEDINSVTANLATRQDILQSLQALKVSFPKWDNKLSEFETKWDVGMARIEAKFRVQNIYLAIIGILLASSSPIFSPLIKAVGRLMASASF